MGLKDDNRAILRSLMVEENEPSASEDDEGEEQSLEEQNRTRSTKEPVNAFGLSEPDTLELVHKRRRKYTASEARYEEPTDNPATACGACRFYLRKEGSKRGGCEVVEKLVHWKGTCDYYISALALAYYYLGEHGVYSERTS